MDRWWWGDSGVSWTRCKSFAPCSGQITMPASHRSIFTGCMLLVTSYQQNWSNNIIKIKTSISAQKMHTNLDELSFLTVFALPNASSTGFVNNNCSSSSACSTDTTRFSAFQQLNPWNNFVTLTSIFEKWHFV